MHRLSPFLLLAGGSACGSHPTTSSNGACSGLTCASTDTEPDGGESGEKAALIRFGANLTATLSAEAGLEIDVDGKALLVTPKGQSLFSAAVDPTNPKGWHDPKSLASVRFGSLPTPAITTDTPSPGVFHLAASAAAADTVLVSLALAMDDGFYTGLGERYDHVDPRGQIVGMQNESDPTHESGTSDRHIPIPWIVSSRGYGVFVKTRQAGAWDVGATDPHLLRATFEGNALDVTIVVNPDPLKVVAALTKMVGLQRPTPTWVLAPMMWRHVDSQTQLEGDLAMIRSLHVPTTTFWIDDGWQVAQNTLDFSPAKYPDAGALLASAAALGFRMFGWNSPYLEAPTGNGAPNEAQQLYPLAAAAGDFVLQNGAPFAARGPGVTCGLVDFTSAAARSFWEGRIERVATLGLDGFKLDYGENLYPSLNGARLGVTLSDGETERTARNYPLDYDRTYRAALASANAGSAHDGGVLVVRASSYGGAALADIVWPGDLDNGFQHTGDRMSNGALFTGGLPASVVAAQTSSAAGFALYGADTAGYPGRPTKESLLRWAEHTAFSMVMQLGPTENKYPWTYDSETLATYTALASAHQQLVPYLAELLSAAELDGTPTIQPLALAYPEDPAAAAFADDEYLLGPALLVAPVVTPGALSRQVHVPPGVWFPYWGGSSVIGPATFDVAAPVGNPPVFVRAGSLLPLLPAGIDTLVAATDASTVTLSGMDGLDEALSWVRGNATAKYLDGSTLSVVDDAAGVLVTWSPQGRGSALAMTLDLSARTGKASTISQALTISGTNVTAGTSAALASGLSGYYVAGAQAWLRLVGPTAVRFQ